MYNKKIKNASINDFSLKLLFRAIEGLNGRICRATKKPFLRYY